METTNRMEPIGLVAEKLVQAVLSEKMIEPESLKKRFESILLIWHNATTRRKDYEKPMSESKECKLRCMVDRKFTEATFWRSKLKLQGLSQEQMEEYHAEIKSILTEQGLLK